MIVISSYLLAQAFDRFLPSPIAYVSPRFGSPVVAQGIVLAITVALVGATAFSYGSLQALFAAVIAAMIYFAFIGVTAAVHGARNEKGGTRTLLLVCGALTAVVFAYICYQFLAAPAIWGTGAIVAGYPRVLVRLRLRRRVFHRGGGNLSGIEVVSRKEGHRPLTGVQGDSSRIAT